VSRSAATYSRWFLASEMFYPEDGGNMFLRNVGSHKNYTVPHPRKRHSSDNRFFENVAEFRYLGTTITNQNLIEEEINPSARSFKFRCHVSPAVIFSERHFKFSSRFNLFVIIFKLYEI
jgi:hypothetical protein